MVSSSCARRGGGRDARLVRGVQATLGPGRRRRPRAQQAHDGEVELQLRSRRRTVTRADGTALGLTPLSIETAYGDVPTAYEIRKAGFVTKKVDIVPNLPSPIFAELEREAPVAPPVAPPSVAPPTVATLPAERLDLAVSRRERPSRRQATANRRARSRHRRRRAVAADRSVEDAGASVSPARRGAGAPGASEHRYDPRLRERASRSLTRHQRFWRARPGPWAGRRWST